MRKQSFIKGSAILISSAVISKAIGAVFKIPLTNMLGGDGMSSFSCAYGLFLPVYAIASGGLTTAIAKLTAENAAQGRYDNIKKLHKTALILFSAAGTVLSVLIFLLAGPFSEKAASCPDGKLSVMMIAPSVLAGCITAVYRGCREGASDMYPTAISQVIESAVRLSAGLGLCLFVLNSPEKVMPYLPKGTSITTAAAAAAVLGITISSVAGTAFMYICGNGCEKLSGGSKDRTRKIISDIMRIFLPTALGAAATNLTSLADLGTIVRCLENAGQESNMKYDPEFIYGSFMGLSVTVFNLIPSVTNMFGKGILPFISACCASNNKSGVKRLSERVTAVTAFIAVPCGLGLCTLSKPVLLFLFSKRAEECIVSAPSLSILGIAAIFLCLSVPLFSCFQAAGRADIPVKLTLAGAAVKLSGNLLLIPQPSIGICGAAVSTLLCYLAIFLLCLIFYPKTVGVSINISFLVPIGISGILCALTAFIVYPILPFSNFLSMPLSAAAGAAVYFTAAFISGAYKSIRSV